MARRTTLRDRHIDSHLRKARRLLEKYWTVVRTVQPFPFHFLAWRAGDFPAVRVECACEDKKLSCDRDLLATASVPLGARKEVWFLPRRWALAPTVISYGQSGLKSGRPPFSTGLTQVRSQDL